MSERKILVVDDDINILRSLSKQFTTILPGYLMLTAMSGNDGLNKVKTQNPDIAIIDVRLGKESGMDLLKEFYDHGNLHWNRSPRFIVMTAYADENVKKDALEKYKVDAFLIKPFVAGEIEEAVLSSLEKSITESCENEMKQMKENYDRQVKKSKEKYEHELREVSSLRKMMADKKDRAKKAQKQVEEDKRKAQEKNEEGKKDNKDIQDDKGDKNKK